MLSKREAKAEGTRAGHAAATWFEPSDAVIRMLDDGDPQADEYMPRRPDLSGEWAGESMTELLQLDGDEDADDADEIADIWLAAADAAYDKEIARAIREFIRGSRGPRTHEPRPRYNPRGASRGGGPRIVTHGKRRR